MKIKTTFKVKRAKRPLNPASKYYKICPFSECLEPFMANRINQIYCCKQHRHTDYNWHHRKKLVSKSKKHKARGNGKKENEFYKNDYLSNQNIETLRSLNNFLRRRNQWLRKKVSKLQK